MSTTYDHLIHIKDHSEVALYELIPDVVWIFDLDKHGWWWGNSSALEFWGLSELDELINKDLSGDTQGAKERTAQTFELAAKNGLTIDPWTTYPNGKPKTLYMRHRAVLVGPDKHRAIIAFINEEVNLGDTPENLLLVEAMRYTHIMVTSFSYSGTPVVENPAATDAYKHLRREGFAEGQSFFSERFVDKAFGAQVLTQAVEKQGGQWTCDMHTSDGPKTHTLDVRVTRHPLTGEFLLLVSEYDVSPLHAALHEAHEAHAQLQQLAHYDPVTGIASMHYLLDKETELIELAQQPGGTLSILYLDLDGFKAVNDSRGHEAGNQVLTCIAERLLKVVDDRGQAIRIGGDEFVIWLDRQADTNSVMEVAEEVLAAVCQDVYLPNDTTPINITTSIGVAHFPQHGRSLEALIQAADGAMYQVKRSGKCAVVGC